jgi:hypothetical protein
MIAPLLCDCFQLRLLSALQGSGNSADCSSGIFHFMFPDTNHAPAVFSQGRPFLPVTPDVSINFGLPVLFVAGGSAKMLRTPVPEATVYENCHSELSEDDVGTTRQIFSVSRETSDPGLSQMSHKCFFKPGIPASDSSHNS